MTMPDPRGITGIREELRQGYSKNETGNEELNGLYERYGNQESID
jgi:hypothetical protein